MRAACAGAYAAVLGGLDAFVFTAGIGEHSARVRAALCRNLAWLGVKLDEQANAANGPQISAPGSTASVWVIPTNEELMSWCAFRELNDWVSDSGRLVLGTNA